MDFKSILKDLFPTLDDNKMISIVGGIGDELKAQSMTLEDIKYLQPQDLAPWLSIMQARKVIAKFSESDNVMKANVSTVPCLDLCGSSLSNSVSSSSLLCWEKLPKKMLSILKQKKRPSPSERISMIKSFVDDILAVYEKPGREILRKVAIDIVGAYPHSFCDQLAKDSGAIGSGHYTLLVQLENRVANVRRKSKISKQNFLRSDNEDDTSAVLSTKHDAYGCVAWQPEQIPVGETIETLEDKRKTLIDVYNMGPTSWNKKSIEVKDLMNITYYLQRIDINGGMSVNDLKNRWPFLFVDAFLNQHLLALTNVDAVKCFKEFLSKRALKIIKFFTSLGPKVKDCLKLEREMQTAIAKTKVIYSQLTALIHMMINAFAEDPSFIFKQVEDDSVQSLAKMDLPNTPCLITKGKSPYYAEKFSLTVDQVIVSDFTDALSALAAMFASYFILNIKYSSSVPCMLEFIQRVIVEINPEKGARTQKKSGNRQWNFSVQVMRLVNAIHDFDDLV